MSEPSKVSVSFNPIRAKYGERGKTISQLSSQLDRLYYATNEALSEATSAEEKRRIRDRYLRAGEIWERYHNNMGTSPRMGAALREYAKQNGSLRGVESYAPNVVIPRSQYMKRKNNR